MKFTFSCINRNCFHLILVLKPFLYILNHHWAWTLLPVDTCRTDPVRPFISGHVANSMAAEVIALLHSLLMAPESNAAQIWTTTAEKVGTVLLISWGSNKGVSVLSSIWQSCPARDILVKREFLNWPDVLVYCSSPGICFDFIVSTL